MQCAGAVCRCSVQVQCAVCSVQCDFHTARSTPWSPGPGVLRQQRRQEVVLVDGAGEERGWGQGRRARHGLQKPSEMGLSRDRTVR
jgi:hypothetical protein